MTLIKIGSNIISEYLPFIYIIYSKENHCVYIGQTLNQGGLIRRFADHLINSSFKKHYVDKYGNESFKSINDLSLFYYPLPQKPRFTSIEPCFREAVEYNLQILFREYRFDPYLTIISKVSNNNISAVNQLDLRMSAKEIFQRFSEIYYKG